MSNPLRALWTFLFYALVGPFFAVLAVAFLIALGSASGISGLVHELPPLGEAVLGTFVWSAVPAALTGLALAACVLRRGGFNWMIAAAAAVIAFGLASLILPLWLVDLRPYLAILAGLVAIGVRAVLLRAGILPP